MSYKEKSSEKAVGSARSVWLCDLLDASHPWRVLKPFEELAKKTFCRLLVASALHQDIQHVAILIYSPPERVRFPVDLQIDFIQVPVVATTRAAAT